MWNDQFNEVLPLLGHRNWILIVDKAYPLQSAAGISYINTNQDHGSVIKEVLSKIDQSTHIKPIIYADKELDVLPQIGAEEAAMLQVMKDALGDREIQSIPHDDIFAKLDTASKLFNVVVLKTESTIAYTSLFIELDCGYWTAEKEQQLRSLLNNGQ